MSMTRSSRRVRAKLRSNPLPDYAVALIGAGVLAVIGLGAWLYKNPPIFSS